MTDTTAPACVAVGDLVKGRCYALNSVRNADGSLAVIWRISSVGPKWITFCEWRERAGGGPGKWSGLYRLLRSGWSRGEPFLPVEDPSGGG